MRLFGPIYDRCRTWASHHLAARYLFWMSVAESIFFPVPVDVMLAPMALARPSRWWRLAVLCAVGSVLGGLVGYALGALALEATWPLIQRLGWDATFIHVQELFVRHGIWIVFVAAFTPIPYKVFTLAAGATGIGLLPFISGSLVGRGARFLLVAGLVAWGGPRVEPMLRRYIEVLGWLVALLVLIALAWMEFRR
ncbi:DedA family protein [Lysobacter sp. GX 14042]|uniref:YqaA family protein n=1 Tax=Lysobacter sp. GX 14042 TaxID=2907155 RepID=UPI001F3246AC|nr:YqaA family protein [Lysobacter sp. GX 14042]MCE7032578.1 DedA family protein [Lysobacter sp. GX 14042]